MESIMRKCVVTSLRQLRLVPALTCLVVALACVPALHAQASPDPAARQTPANPPTAPPPSTAAQEGFVPVEQLPNPQDTIPAPRLVASAYALVWIVLMAYLYSIWRRLGTVKRELDTLSRRLSPGTRRP
jgi:hypothetical protein